MSRRCTNSMSRRAHSTSRGSMLSRKRAVTIGTNPCAGGGTPKPSRFPIRVLPTEPGNALWVSAAPSNVGYWGQSGKHGLFLRFTAFDPIRTSGAVCQRLQILHGRQHDNLYDFTQTDGRALTATTLGEFDSEPLPATPYNLTGSFWKGQR